MTNIRAHLDEARRLMEQPIEASEPMQVVYAAISLLGKTLREVVAALEAIERQQDDGK